MKKLKQVIAVYRTPGEMDIEPTTYREHAVLALQNKALANEAHGLINEFGTFLVRHTKTQEETAFYRGAIYGLEQYLRRLDKIAKAPTPSEKQDLV